MAAPGVSSPPGGPFWPLPRCEAAGSGTRATEKGRPLGWARKCLEN